MRQKKDIVFTSLPEGLPCDIGVFLDNKHIWYNNRSQSYYCTRAQKWYIYSSLLSNNSCSLGEGGDMTHFNL